MIALDTNLLVYAHRSAMPEHKAARRAIEDACNSRRGCGVAVQALAEFWSVATHPAAARPSSPSEAAAFLRSLQEEGGLVVFMPGPAFAERLVQTAADLEIRGPRVFDLQIALCAMDCGATELWSRDERFVKVPGLRVRNPLETPHAP